MSNIRLIAFISGLALIILGAIGLLTNNSLSGTISDIFTIGGFTIAFLQVFFEFPLLNISQYSSFRPAHGGANSIFRSSYGHTNSHYHVAGSSPVRGWALLTGSVLLLIAAVLFLIVTNSQNQASYSSNTTPPLYVWATILSLLAGTLIPFGLPRLQEKQAIRTGLLGQVTLVWFILAWLGIDLQWIVSLFSYSQQVYITQTQPASVTPLTFILCLLLIIPATILWGITILYADTFPRWVGITSLVVALLVIVYLTAPSSQIITLLEISILFLAGAIARCGYLLRQTTF